MAITTEFSKSFIVYRQAPQWLNNQNNNQQQADQFKVFDSGVPVSSLVLGKSYVFSFSLSSPVDGAKVYVVKHPASKILTSIDNTHFQADIKLEDLGITDAGEYNLEIKVYSKDDKVLSTQTKTITVTSGGVSPNGVCGPATSGVNNGKSGKCLASCATFDDLIADTDISDINKKCAAPNKCCIK